MNKTTAEKSRRLLAALLICVLLFTAGCTPKEDPAPGTDEPDPAPQHVDTGTFLCLSPSLALSPEFVKEKTGVLPVSLLYTSTTSVAVSCLLDGTGDSLFTLAPVAEFYAARTEGLSAEVSDTRASLSMLVSKEKTDLAGQLSDVIRRFKSDGTIVDLYATWVDSYKESGRPENADTLPEIPVLASRSDGEIPETIRVGVSGTLPLIDYLLDDGVAGGFTAALWAAIAEELEVNVKFVSVLPESKVSALIDDKIDVYYWHFLDVPDMCVATEPYLTVYYALLSVE